MKIREIEDREHDNFEYIIIDFYISSSDNIADESNIV